MYIYIYMHTYNKNPIILNTILLFICIYLFIWSVIIFKPKINKVKHWTRVVKYFDTLMMKYNNPL